MPGYVAPGFEPVREAFVRNFNLYPEVGAAFAAYAGDNLVVDLWGGLANSETAALWQSDTPVMLFSGTKVITSVCMLLLVEANELNTSLPVSHYWPEFAQAGKKPILVRHVLSHLAGVPAIRTRLAPHDILDNVAMAARLAREIPFWPAPARLCYHPLTFGWICGELVRRITGTDIGTFFARNVASPLHLDAWLGLPKSLARRVATLYVDSRWGCLNAQTLSHPLARLVYHNPPMRFRAPLLSNTLPAMTAQVPASNAIATARSMARLMACLALGGMIDDVRILTEASTARALMPLSKGQDPFLRRPLAFAFGLQLQTSRLSYGPPPDAFGHTGVGGSVHGAWPTHGISYSYVMNNLCDFGRLDPRAQHLLDALHGCITSMRAVTPL